MIYEIQLQYIWKQQLKSLPVNNIGRYIPTSYIDDIDMCALLA